MSYPVDPGFHTFTWSYEKDDAVTSGQDRAWVDEILLPPNEIVVVTGGPENNVFGVKVMPNPVTGLAWLEIVLSSEQSVGVEIFDCLGRRMYTWRSETRIPAGGHMQSFDMNNFTPGVYFVQLTTENGLQKLLKIVKQ